MGIFKRQVEGYDESTDPLPPPPENEIGEVQKLAEMIWNFENHARLTWLDIRTQHELGYASATSLYMDRINLANHILERYQPREIS